MLIGTGTAAVSVLIAHVAGAHIAAAINGHHLDAGLRDSLLTLWRVPSHLSDPAGAWQVHGVLPGAGLYWAVVIGALPLFRYPPSPGPLRGREGPCG